MSAKPPDQTIERTPGPVERNDEREACRTLPDGSVRLPFDTCSEGLEGLARILDGLPIPLFVKDTSGVFLCCNLELERMVGVPRERIVGKTVDELWPARLARIYAGADIDLLSRGGTQTYEAPVELPNGDLRYVVFNKSTFVDSRGELAGIIGALVDITRRRQVERTLQQTLARHGKRLRQLECLHDVAQLVAHDTPPDGFLPRIVELVRRACHSSGAVGVRLRFGGVTYTSHDYCETSWSIAESIEMSGDMALAMSVFYRQALAGGHDSEIYEEERRLVRSVVVQASAHLDRSFAEASLRRRLDLESAVSRVTSRFMKAEDFEASMSEALEEIARLIGAESAVVSCLDESGRYFVDVIGSHPARTTAARRRLLGERIDAFPWGYRAFERGKTVRIHPGKPLPVEAAAERQLMEDLKIESILMIPVLQGGELSGCAAFTNVMRPETWQEEETAILRVFAELATNMVIRRRRTERVHQLATAVQQSADGIGMLDADGLVRYVNPAFETLSSASSRDLIGRNFWDFFPDEHQGAGHTRVRESLARGDVYTGHFRHRAADGTALEEDCTISPIRNGSGEIASYLVVRRDVTEKANLEQELRRAQKLESIGQLAAGIAHEINTPTQYVGDNTRFLDQAFSELMPLLEQAAQVAGNGMEDDESSVAWVRRFADLARAVDLEFLVEEVPQAIEQSLEGIERVSKIVLAMREFSHPGECEAHPVDINRAIRNTSTVSRNVWKYDSDLVLDLDDSLPPVPCIESEFNQVMLNLITNAAHAITEMRRQTGSKEKGELRISTRERRDMAEIRVTDSGTGIPDEIGPRIFDLFFTTKEVGQGTGQGLPLVHSVVVEKLKGSIDYTTACGEGTTFIVRLPLG